MSTRVIEVISYTDAWIKQFLKEKQLLESSIDTDTLITIHHIGSTSVAGLSAKPVIDIMLEVSSLKLLDNHNSTMEQLGYVVKGEYGVEGRRYYQKGEEQRTHHVHAFLTGDPNIKRHLVFRDYLVAFPQIRQTYDALKREAAHLCDNDIEKYIAHKNEFIKHHEKLALKWAKEKNRLP